MMKREDMGGFDFCMRVLDSSVFFPFFFLSFLSHVNVLSNVVYTTLAVRQ